MMQYSNSYGIRSKAVAMTLSNLILLLDIDECTLELDSCEQICINLDGSYTCECNEGYDVSRTFMCEGIIIYN